MDARAMMIETYLCSTSAFRHYPLPDEQKPKYVAKKRKYHPPSEISPGSLQWTIQDYQSDNWRIFAVPDLAIGKPPRRIDIHLTSLQSSPFQVAVLDDGIRNELLTALSQWYTSIPNFADLYMNAPFGSYIVVNGFSEGRKATEVQLVRSYDTEQSWLSIEDLQKAWRKYDISWPQIVHLNDLKFEQQLHEAISLVQKAEDGGDQTFVLKTVLSDIDHFYLELKTLLTFGHHKNIEPAPRYLVVADCKLGGKIGVCGLLSVYYDGGTLGETLWQSSQNQPIPLAEKLRWSLEIISALSHIRHSPTEYFSDLKPSNILMPFQNGRASPLLIDFEQRGGRAPWIPPEIYYIDIIEDAARSEAEPHIVEKYSGLMRMFQSDWKIKPRLRWTLSDNEFHGHTTAWRGLTKAQRQSSQVYMFGRLLWCIFEDCGSVSNGLDFEAIREPLCKKRFGTFETTPIAIQNIIRSCTAGAPEWYRHFPPLVIRDGRLYSQRNGHVDEEELPFASDEATAAARSWWQGEVKDAERFLKAFCRKKNGAAAVLGDGEVLSFLTKRPSLEEVRDMLEATR